MSLRAIDSNSREALRIVEAFGDALAKAEIYPKAALELALNYIATPEFSGDRAHDDIIAAFIKFLNDQLKERQT